MPKSSKEQIKEDGIKVIMEILNNSRLSINDIAKKCGFSRQKVWRIINTLEKNKTIWGYNTVIDENSLGLKQFFILFKRNVSKISDKQLDLATNRVWKEILEKAGVLIEGSYYTHGSCDWIVLVSAKNIVEIKKFVEYINQNYHDVISDIQIVEVLFPLHKNGIENPKKEELVDFFK